MSYLSREVTVYSRKLLHAFFPALAVAAILSCGDQTHDTYTVDILEGVRHVHNHAPLQGNTPNVRLEFVQKIGSLETEDENYQLYHPLDLAVDEDSGTIFILDAGNKKVKMYDRDGTFLSSFGQSGGGPGDFQNPVALEADSDGSLLITDSRRRRCVRFDHTGAELETIAFEGDTVYRLKRAGKGRFIAPLSVTSPEPENHEEHACPAALFGVGRNARKFRATEVL